MVNICQDSVKVHIFEVSVETRKGYEIRPHPTYLHDLTPGDYFLSPNLKEKISVGSISGPMKKLR